jgi:hypothetical protein
MFIKLTPSNKIEPLFIDVFKQCLQRESWQKGRLLVPAIFEKSTNFLAIETKIDLNLTNGTVEFVVIKLLGPML